MQVCIQHALVCLSYAYNVKPDIELSSLTAVSRLKGDLASLDMLRQLVSHSCLFERMLHGCCKVVES